MKGIKNGKVYLESKFEENKVLIYDQKIIDIFDETRLEEWLKLHSSEDETAGANIEWIDADGQYVVPGFIDVHIHGYKGNDVMDCKEENVIAIAQGIVENGVTSFLATTMTMPIEQIDKALNIVRAVQQREVDGANVLGVHMEGPFINEAFKGAQPKDAIIVPDQAFVEKNLDVLKVITIAPEVEGAVELIERFGDKVNFSLGHTGATYEKACEAIEHGACCTTHLFSAMTGLHHRKPGVVGAAFNKDIYSELIADTIHVNPELFELITKMVGLDKLLLITDCMQGGGLEEGYYELGGQKVLVKDGKCTLESGTIAGSVLTLDKGLKNLEAHVSHALEELIPTVTINQATYLGLEDRIGTLGIGKQADIVLMDNGLNIRGTIVKGSRLYEA